MEEGNTTTYPEYSPPRRCYLERRRRRNSPPTTSRISPAGSGTVDVVVSANALTSAIVLADQFTYTVAASRPTVTAISPTSGTTLGGTIVTITGTGFSTAAGATSVAFGATNASIVACSTTTSCTATSPSGALGPVDVLVTANGLQSAVTNVDKFTYVLVPVQTDVQVPALPKGYGYWFTFTSSAAGTLGATWTLSSATQGTLSIYTGNPFAGKSNPVKLSPPSGGLIATRKATASNFSVVTASMPAGTYTAYFFSSKTVPASSGTVTYVK